MPKKRKQSPSVPVISSNETQEQAALTVETGRSVVPLVERGAIQLPQGGGRPSLTITDEGLTVVERMAASGESKTAIAARLGIHRRRLTEMMADESDDNAVLAAWERGDAENEATLVRHLQSQAAKGYSPAAMFLLKTRHGYRETEAAQAATLAVQINLPQNMSREQWEALQAKGE